MTEAKPLSQEYVGDRGKDQDKDWIVGEKERFDSELDKNGDGSLGRAEMVEWLIPSQVILLFYYLYIMLYIFILLFIPSQDSIADDEVKHLFNEADDDDDDVLR